MSSREISINSGLKISVGLFGSRGPTKDGLTCALMDIGNLGGQILVIPQLYAASAVQSVQHLVGNIVVRGEVFQGNDLALSDTVYLGLLIQQRLDQLESPFGICAFRGNGVQIVTQSTQNQRLVG